MGVIDWLDIPTPSPTRAPGAAVNPCSNAFQAYNNLREIFSMEFTELPPDVKDEHCNKASELVEFMQASNCFPGEVISQMKEKYEAICTPGLVVDYTKSICRTYKKYYDMGYTYLVTRMADRSCFTNLPYGGSLKKAQQMRDKEAYAQIKEALREPTIAA